MVGVRVCYFQIVGLITSLLASLLNVLLIDWLLGWSPQCFFDWLIGILSIWGSVAWFIFGLFVNLLVEVSVFCGVGIDFGYTCDC